MKYPDVVAFIPNTNIQFLDFEVDLTPILGKRLAFAECEPELDTDARKFSGLRLLSRTDEGKFKDPSSGEILPEESVYELALDRVLAQFERQWTPVPFFRSDSISGMTVFDDGPHNWTRLWLTRTGDGLRMVLAVDTSLARSSAETSGDGAGFYNSPDIKMAQGGAEFRFVSRFDHLKGYLAREWLEGWLSEQFRTRLQTDKDRELRKEDFRGRQYEHVAAYLTLLHALGDQHGWGPPGLRLAAPPEADGTFVTVDLILDIGNSRTCGVIVETFEGEPLDLSQSHPLELRSLSDPQKISTEPFDSRVEFAEAHFGSRYWSLVAGRADAFRWPSLVRVGREASLLAERQTGGEGMTGLSTPKRYLWDLRECPQSWRFNRTSLGDQSASQPVSGQLLHHVADDGEVLSYRKLVSRGPDVLEGAWEARFSRSSIYTLFLHELLVHATTMMNSPNHRLKRRWSDQPRRLRRITITQPSAAPMEEQKLLQKRALSAVLLFGDLMGAVGPMPDEDKMGRFRMRWENGAVQLPTVNGVETRFQWDEATATQLVYLYAEVAKRFGSPEEYLEIAGRPRKVGETAGPSLRIASIDVGGGTTDLMVSTYRLQGEKTLLPQQNFREGFRVAGDDALRAVVEDVILSGIAGALDEAGHEDGRALLRLLFGGDSAAMSEQRKTHRRAFVSKIIMPAALALLARHERDAPFSRMNVLHTVKFADVVDLEAEEVAWALGYLIPELGAAVRENFEFGELTISVAANELKRVINAVLDPVLMALCEIIGSYDCDKVLISGRPSRLPGVYESLVRIMPVTSDRIVPLYGFPVGAWYPFRSPMGRIADPKSTVAVGAMLCSLFERALVPEMSVLTHMLSLDSTAKYIGLLDSAGDRLRNDRIIFSTEERVKEKRLLIEGPSVLGYRQVPVERWPAQPLYFIDIKDAAELPNVTPPLTIELEPAQNADEIDGIEQFDLRGVEDARDRTIGKEAVAFTLRTERTRSGSYWLDTGAFEDMGL